MTHLGNATGTFHQRSPGLFGAALCDDRVAVSVIADLEHVHADTLNLAFKAKGRGGVVLVTDSVATTAATVGPVSLASGPPGAAARLADGTLAGSVLTMDRAITNVVTHAEVSLEQAVYAASTTPASLLGLFGSRLYRTGHRAPIWSRCGDAARTLESLSRRSGSLAGSRGRPESTPLYGPAGGLRLCNKRAPGDGGRDG